MKDKFKQIEFMDKTLLPIYGIKSVQDYSTKVSLNDIKKNKTIIQQLNDILPELKDIFPVKEFNLHKTNDKVNSDTQVYAILKKCLQLANILFDVFQDNKVNYVRLIPKNILLENYINKMSDIRENKNLMLESNSDEQTKKYIIDYEELGSSIKKETIEEYYIPLFLLVKSEESIIIPLSEIISDLNRMEIDFIAENKIEKHLVDKEVIDKVFYGSKYEILSNNDKIYESVLEKHKNILPLGVFPFSKNIYSPLSIKIYCKLPYELLRNIINIKITINKIEFIKKMSDKLDNKNYYIEIPFDKNIMIFSYGMITSKIPSKIPIEIKTNFNEIDGDKYQIGKYQCFRVKESNNFIATDLLYFLVCGYDIVTQYIKNRPIKCNFYTKDDNTYTFTHQFIRDCDAITNIKINFPESIKYISNINISLDGFNESKIYNLRTIDYKSNYIWENDNKCLQLNFKENQYIGFLNCGGTKLTIEITNENDIFNILQNTTISYDVLMVHQKLRTQLMSTYDDFVLENI